jgi:hypothetical protein
MGGLQPTVALRSLNPRSIESSNAGPPADVIFLAKNMLKI